MTNADEAHAEIAYAEVQTLKLTFEELHCLMDIEVRTFLNI